MTNPSAFATWVVDKITLKEPVSRREELANGITHGIGALLSVVATVLLIVETSLYGDAYRIVGCAIFGFSMIMLYSASTLYHLSQGPVSKRLFRVMDHLSIYLLIAGTYSPIVLSVRGVWGWSLFAAIWSCALFGAIFTIAFWGRFKILGVLIYVGMGWLILVDWQTFRDAATGNILEWALAGGIVYTLGAVVYATKRIPYGHAVWHLFVLGGSICFFIGVYFNMTHS